MEWYTKIKNLMFTRLVSCLGSPSYCFIKSRHCKNTKVKFTKEYKTHFNTGQLFCRFFFIGKVKKKIQRISCYRQQGTHTELYTDWRIHWRNIPQCLLYMNTTHTFLRFMYKYTYKYECKFMHPYIAPSIWPLLVNFHFFAARAPLKRLVKFSFAIIAYKFLHRSNFDRFDSDKNWWFAR